MEEIFLFVLALIWIVFASVQDLKTREVANWLTFSLIAFALAYRGFFTLLYDDMWFFLFGLLGFGLFFCLAHAFYYGRVFAGGDAKLLMGVGAVLPFHSFNDYFILTLVFLLSLFFVGALYSVAYSAIASVRYRERFVPAFAKSWKSYSFLWLAPVLLSLLLFFVKTSLEGWLVLSAFFFFLPLAFIYLKAFEQGCLVTYLSPEKLTAGDWLERDVRVAGKVLKNNVHGLSLKEIAFLRKHHKKVWIKQGIPFVPAFFIAFAIMVSFEIFAPEAIQDWILSLFSLF